MHRKRFLSDRDVAFCFDSIDKGIKITFLAHYVYGITYTKLRDALHHIKRMEQKGKHYEWTQHKQREGQHLIGSEYSA